ncbi:DUF2529 family protein [Fervidibacillus albus]|uniref:DUF2529 domain-containing protein n=1 Tax=Fervidibacillus albus TaxID=2980026 RepID=A0A9E8LUZ8_9BACI|nr:DUF2529 family protein [Fervidibacillus albus]WAA09641.1 DUF2529 domain-containing protein [Fervidibacillus albus]
MEKIFTTQLIGKLKKIEEQEQEAVEDGARLLSQALVGDGNIYIYAQNEMAGVFYTSAFGQEPLQRVKRLTDETVDDLSPADRGILFSRTAEDEGMLRIAHMLRNKQIPFIIVCSPGEKTQDLDELADVIIRLHSEKGLVPSLNGEKTGYPDTIAALFVYHHLKLLIEEMMEDYE